MDSYNPWSNSGDALAQLRHEVLRDAPWSARLADLDEPQAFVAELARDAAARGIAASAESIGKALRGDPLGLARFVTDAASEKHWPPAPWLPIHVNVFAPQPTVDWAYFGPQPITAPFFEGAIREAHSRPFNRLFPYRMTLVDFVADAPRHATGSVPPAGFIFHMSRCGSTLVSQMLTQSPRSVVISEAAPIDIATRMANTELLRAMAIAYGRRRSGDEQRLVFKLDAWHVLALPLFMRAFPGAPWIFLYRDPVEVLVSQEREPGPQMVRQITPPALYGLDADASEPDLDYTARALGRICAAAAAALSSPRGLAINYRELPDAVEARVLPHFGIEADAAERAAMRAAARLDAKMPNLAFSADKSAKQAAAPAALRQLADRTLRDVIDRLDAIAAAR